jgi:hypothetical protein
LEAYGDDRAGYFENNAGSSSASLARGGNGVWSTGNERGGYFSEGDTDAYAHVAAGGYGISAYGTTGVKGVGTTTGGYFEQEGGASSALIADAAWGVSGYGLAGGLFGQDSDSGTWGEVGTGGYSTHGNGSKNFVQNHPFEADRVIEYSALEGDEVGTYTRGRARLIDGLAKVRLGETFAWVTNPDIGLTAQVTARGEAVPLAVTALSTTEMTVEAPPGGAQEVAFDYVVQGLRIGFEEKPVVVAKRREAYIPRIEHPRDAEVQSLDLARHEPLERFRAMGVEMGESGALDLTAANALRRAIQVFDPEIHGAPSEGRDRISPALDDGPMHAGGPATMAAPPGEAAPDRRAEAPVALPALETGHGGAAGAEVVCEGAWLAVVGQVEPGEVLVFDPEQSGLLRPASSMADTALAGIALGPSAPSTASDETVVLRVCVAVTGLVECKIDAGYGAVRAGDLLTTSPTPGHAMRSLEVIPGAVLGKAAEPLDVGTGTIKVLVMPR